MKLQVGKRAQHQIRTIETWWVEHRPSAPMLFTDELERTFRHLCAIRDAGIRWPTPRRPALRRVLMPRSGHHVYFLPDDGTSTVHVVAVWGAPRGTAPEL